jgi:hypothetical protein
LGFIKNIGSIIKIDAETQLGLEAAVSGATLPDDASAAEIAGFYVGETLGAAAMVMSGEAILPMAQEAVGLAATVYSSLSQFWARGGTEMGDVIDLSAANHINLLRLQRQLTIEQANSIFDESGGLTQEAIDNSLIIKQGEELGNPALRNDLINIGGNIADWGKYTTKSIASPSGNFGMHFYYNPVTGNTYYGMDYKAVFDHNATWDLPITPNFDYEPKSFNS